MTSSDQPVHRSHNARERTKVEFGFTRRQFVIGAGALAIASRASFADAGSAPIYRIHPAIGIARIGNADPDTYYLGPETPGSVPSGPYKVPGGDGVVRIRPQAARFQIWEYTRNANGTLAPLRQVKVQQDGVTEIQWQVHLANRKSAFFQENGPNGEVLAPGPLRNAAIADRNSLQTDFGARQISASGGAEQPAVLIAFDGNPNNPSQLYVKGPDGVTPVIDYLGQLRVDENGNLIVLGGRGKSASNVSPPKPLTDRSNNDNWFDDISDGPVTATVTLNGVEIPMDAGVGNAWVLVAPPRFAPGIRPAVSLYDVLFNMGVVQFPIPNNALYRSGGPLVRLAQLNQLNPPPWPPAPGSFQADFQSEIWPVLSSEANYLYVTALLNAKLFGLLTNQALGDPSAASASMRSQVFQYLRAPSGFPVSSGPGTLPFLYGDDWFQKGSSSGSGQNGTGNAGGSKSYPAVPQYLHNLTITATQYWLMSEWSAGSFLGVNNPLPPPAPSPFDLDRAALENCLGGPFYPGIECGWQIRNPKLFAEPFRIRYDPNNVVNRAISQYLVDSNLDIEGTPIGPGHFTRQMSVPWQSDLANTTRGASLTWWPSHRPDDVFVHPTDTPNQRVTWARATAGIWPSGNTNPSFAEMVANWWKFGFVVPDPSGVYIESERANQIP